MNGILGGFTGDGVKTIIPAKAMAKITMRLVPHQNPEKILDAAKKYIQELAPSNVKLTLEGGVGGPAYMTPIDHPVLSYVSQTISKVYDREPLFTRTGGTIGVLSTFSEVLQIPIVLVNMGHPNDMAHAPNEHMHENAFYTGMEVAAHLLNELKSWKPE